MPPAKSPESGLQESLFDFLREALISADTRLVCTGWNAAAERILGWTGQEAIGKPLADLLDLQVSSLTTPQVFHHLKRLGSFSGTGLAAGKAGQRTAVEIQAGSFNNGFWLVMRPTSQRAEVLAELSKALAEVESDEQRVIETTGQRITEIFRDTCVITVISEDGEWLEPAVIRAPNDEITQYVRQLMEMAPTRVGEGLAGRVVETGNPVMIPSISDEQARGIIRPEFWAYMERFGIRGLILVPLRVQGRVIGSIGLSRSRPEPYTSDDLTFLQNLADHAALAFNNARLFKALQVELSERKRAEAARRTTKTLFESLFDSAPEAILLVDDGGRIARANRRTSELFGYALEELTGQPVELLIPGRFQEMHEQYRQAYHAEPVIRPMGLGLELFGMRKDGAEFPVDITLSPLHGKGSDQVICLIHDISPRKQIEGALREKDRLIKTAVSGLPVLLFVMNAQGVVQLYLGKGTRLLFGGRDLTGLKVDEIASSLPGIAGYFRRSLAGEVLDTAWEVEGLVLDAHFAPMLDEREEITGVIGVATDITGRVAAEDALRSSELRFRTVFDKSPVGITLAALDGRFLQVNPAMAAMIGYPVEELLELKIDDITYPADQPASRQLYKALIQGEIDHFTQEKRYQCKDGSPIWARLAVSLVRSPDGAPQFAIGMVESIQDRKQMEAELAEVQRRLIDSIESERLRLAQDLHDGPVQDLYGVVYAIEGIRDGLHDDKSLEALNNAQHTLQGVLQMLRMTTGELRPPTLGPFGLEKAIRSHADRFQAAHPELTVHLELMPDGNTLPDAVRLALFRVYQHLLRNVIRHSKAANLYVRLQLDVEQILLEVEDDGSGFVVPQRWITLARGGRLGLVGATERAEAIGGKLSVESGPGEGTRVRVVVPRLHLDTKDN